MAATLPDSPVRVQAASAISKKTKVMHRALSFMWRSELSMK
jgi:hypothetical protein